MDQFLDNLARELAKPTSRRGVMRLIGGAMLGGVVAAWKPAPVKAQTCSPPCTAKKPKCCTTGTTPFCVTNAQTCCGNTSCGGNKKCCTTAAAPFCATNDKVCCGKKTCKSSETCCGNTNCCTAKQVCISGQCQASKTPN